MKFVFSNIGTTDPTKDRTPTGGKLVSRSKKKQAQAEEIITGEKKMPLFYIHRIKAPKHEYY